MMDENGNMIEQNAKIKKKNLHYFDKELLIEELVAMTEWLDE